MAKAVKRPGGFPEIIPAKKEFLVRHAHVSKFPYVITIIPTAYGAEEIIPTIGEPLDEPEHDPFQAINIAATADKQ
jgi:hypothetical protein